MESSRNFLSLNVSLISVKVGNYSSLSISSIFPQNWLSSFTFSYFRSGWLNCLDFIWYFCLKFEINEFKNGNKIMTQDNHDEQKLCVPIQLNILTKNFTHNKICKSSKWITLLWTIKAFYSHLYNKICWKISAVEEVEW